MMEVTVIASGSTGNCYRVSDGVTKILLDAGVSIKKIREGCNFNLHEIAACFVTHYHGDHAHAATDLVRLGIPTYMTDGEKVSIGANSSIKTLYKFDGKYIPLNINTLVIRPFKTVHDTPEPVGFMVGSKKTGETLVYFTDTYYLPSKFAPFDYLIGEINYDHDSLWEHYDSKETGAYRAKRLFTSHMSLETFLDFLRNNDLSRLKKLWICHMSDSHGNEARIKEAVQRETGVEVIVC